MWEALLLSPEFSFAMNAFYVDMKLYFGNVPVFHFIHSEMRSMGANSSFWTTRQNTQSGNGDNFQEKAYKPRKFRKAATVFEVANFSSEAPRFRI